MSTEFLVTYITTTLSTLIGAYITVRIYIAKMQVDINNIKDRLDSEFLSNKETISDIKSSIKDMVKDVHAVKVDVAKITSTNETLNKTLEMLNKSLSRNN